MNPVADCQDHPPGPRRHTRLIDCSTSLSFVYYTTKSIDSLTAHNLLYFITVLYTSALFYVQLRLVSWSVSTDYYVNKMQINNHVEFNKRLYIRGNITR